MRAETVSLPSGRQQVVYRLGDGPPLMWLHSLYGAESDAPVVDLLAGAYTVYAPVAPGFAELDELESLRDIHDLALHYDDLLEELHLPEVALAGHSFGAMLAAEIAAHFPNRVRRLVLCSPLGLWNDAYPVADLFGIPQTDAAQLLYADPSRAPGGNASADLESTVALVRGMATVARFLWPIPDRGLARRLYRVRAETLVIHGAQDRFVPVRYADDFVRALPNATKHIIGGAGHMLTVEATDQIAAAITAFLTEKVEARA